MNAFWIILIGFFVAGSCSILGCFLILRKMALVGDAISHSVLPGIVLVFLFTGSRDSVWMMFGAAVFGLLCVYLIQKFQQGGVQTDAAIGVSFTALFSIGVLLISMFTRQVDLDLDCVLYGEIAFAPWDTWSAGGVNMGPMAVWVTGFAFLLNILIVTVFYKQFKICSFDPAMALALGIPVLFFHYLLMGLVSVTTIASFESVGAILVVGMLIVPAATAYLLTDRMSMMIVISVVSGGISSIGGYYMAMVLDASIAGCMITAAGIQFLLVFFLSPTHGMLWKKYKHHKLRQASTS